MTLLTISRFPPTLYSRRAMLRSAFTSILIACALLAFAATAMAQDHDAHPSFKDCSDCPEMIRVPAGHFAMGSPAGEPAGSIRRGRDTPVSVRAFALGKYNVTDTEFLVFLRANRLPARALR